MQFAAVAVNCICGSRRVGTGSISGSATREKNVFLPTRWNHNLENCYLLFISTNKVARGYHALQLMIS
jgi:hypothetical protein